jgi:hypothetical protein
MLSRNSPTYLDDVGVEGGAYHSRHHLVVAVVHVQTGTSKIKIK